MKQKKGDPKWMLLWAEREKKGKKRLATGIVYNQ